MLMLRLHPAAPALSLTTGRRSRLGDGDSFIILALFFYSASSISIITIIAITIITMADKMTKR